MMIKPEHQRLQMVIKDTVRLLVKNGVNFSSELSIQGLLAVNLDQEEMFIIHLDERIGEGEDVCHTCGQNKMINSPASSGRARSWSESNCLGESDSEEELEVPPLKVPRLTQKSPQPSTNNPQTKSQPQSIIIKREKGDYKLHEDWMQCPDLSQFTAASSSSTPCDTKQTICSSTITAKSPTAAESTLTASVSAPSKVALLPISDILPSRKPDLFEGPDNGVHECKLCTYKSPYRGTLNRHMRVHLSEKPFKCPFCDYSSRFRSNLLQHCAHLHPGEGGGGGGGGQLPPPDEGL